MTRVAEVVDSGAIDFDMAVNLTRAVGQTMARLADWEVATLIGRVEEMEAGEQATGSRLGSALRLVETVNGPFESLLIYAWRRHLAAAAARVEALGANEEDLHTTPGDRRVRRHRGLHRALQPARGGAARGPHRGVRVALPRRRRRRTAAG